MAPADKCPTWGPVCVPQARWRGRGGQPLLLLPGPPGSQVAHGNSGLLTVPTEAEDAGGGVFKAPRGLPHPPSGPWTPRCQYTPVTARY